MFTLPFIDMNFLKSRRLRVLTLGVTLLAGGSFAKAQSSQRDFQLSELTSDDLTSRFQPLAEAKKWDEAINFIKGVISRAAPNSYDQAYLNDMLARLYLQKGEYDKAIPPYEIALRLGDTYGYFDKKAIDQMLDYLAKLYYSEGTSSKSPALQQQYLSKATVYIKRVMDATPNPTADSILFYTTLLYNRAVVDPENIDKELLKQASAEAQKGLLSTARPKENFYLILLSTLQQQGDFRSAAEYYELLVKQYPSNKNYWQQLWAIYTNLSQNGDEKAANEFNLRAILTIERAQALGFLNTPKDNYNLVGAYFNIQQFGKATELLYSGLKKGGIESTLANWTLLASCYQQINKEHMAIEALLEASRQFPEAGQLDFQIGQFYYSLEKTADAYRHFKLAIAKGNLTKPVAVYSFLAFMCYELGKFEEGLETISTAIELNGSTPDAQLTRLRQAMEDALRDREAKQHNL